MEPSMDNTDVKRRLTCILAADAVGYSKQMGQDEEGTIRVLSAHRAVIDGIIAYHHGRIVSTAGDSVLAEFGSAVDAVRCAVEIQDALKTRNDALPEHRKMLFRVGVNLGDVVVKNDDLLGDGVNVAARLETMAEPGGICIASSVYDQITGKLNLGFQDIGDQTLKNISRPIHVYRVSGAMAPLKSEASTAPVASVPATSTSPATQHKSTLPWAIAAVMAVAMAGVVWQAGWLGGKPAPVAVAATPAAVAAAPLVTAPVAPASNAVVMQTTADTERLRAEAQALREQAKAELEKAKAQAALAAAKPKVSTEPAAPVRATQVATVTAPAPVAVPPPSPTPPPVAPQAAAPTHPFDGSWNVNVNCPPHEDGAAGYAIDFVAIVSGGMLRGESGTPGEPGWLLLRGEIQPDGKADMVAKGLIGDSKFAVNRVRKGTEYTYPVKAFFEGTQGTGKRMRLRACTLNFLKR
jgi:class 3 adenylate cyclase